MANNTIGWGSIYYSGSGGGSVGTLQQVTDLGDVTTNDIKVPAILFTGDPSAGIDSREGQLDILGEIIKLETDDSASITLSDNIVFMDGNHKFERDAYTILNIDDPSIPITTKIDNESSQIYQRNVDEDWGWKLDADGGLVFTDGSGNGYNGSSAVSTTIMYVGNGSNHGAISSSNITANRDFQLPDADGTIALNSDITINSTTVGEPLGSAVITNIVKISQVDYDAAVTAGTTVATTFYAIV